MGKHLICLCFGLAVTLGACSGSNQSSSAAKEARSYYNSKCATCHGAKGAGDGILAASLNPKPRDYSDSDWQSTVTDEQLEKVILEGGKAGGLSALMPASPELRQDPEMLKEIILLLRSFDD